MHAVQAVDAVESFCIQLYMLLCMHPLPTLSGKYLHSTSVECLERVGWVKHPGSGTKRLFSCELDHVRGTEEDAVRLLYRT